MPALCLLLPYGERQSCAVERCKGTRPPTGSTGRGSMCVWSTCNKKQKKKGGGATKERRKAIKRSRGGGGDEMESKSGIIYNGLRALLRHFIQHLVKRGLFCFACVVSNARRSQFVGSFVKRWTASPASQRCHGAEKSSLAPECRWESGCWRLPAYRLKCGLENNGN